MHIRRQQLNGDEKYELKTVFFFIISIYVGCNSGKCMESIPAFLFFYKNIVYNNIETQIRKDVRII